MRKEGNQDDLKEVDVKHFACSKSQESPVRGLALVQTQPMFSLRGSVQQS